VEGVLIEDRVVDLELQLVAEHSVASAGVDDHPDLAVHLRSTHAEADTDVVLGEVDAADPHSLVDFRAQLVRVLKQQGIELASVHVVRVVLADAGLLAFREAELRELDGLELVPVVRIARSVVAGRPGGSVLPRKFRFLHDGEEIQVTKDARGRWNEGLADVRAWERVLARRRRRTPGLGQIRSHRCARGSATDDADVEARFPVFHSLPSV